MLCVFKELFDHLTIDGEAEGVDFFEGFEICG